MQDEKAATGWYGRCGNCGAEVVPSETAYCPECGQPFRVGKRREWRNSTWFVLLLIFGVCGACSAPFVAAGALWYWVPETRFYLKIVLGVFVVWYILAIVYKRSQRMRDH